MTPGTASASTSATAPVVATMPRGAWHIACALALATLGLFVAFSPAGTSIALAALLLLALLRPRAFLADRPWRDPALAAGLLLMAYIALHTLAVTGWGRSGAAAINRYHELFFVFVLVPLLRDARLRSVLLGALLAGAAGWALTIWLAWLVPSLGSAVHSKRISAGFVLAAVSYLSLMLSTRMRNPWPLRILAALLLVTVLVPLNGRTGHVLVVVLAACAAWVKSPPRWRVAAAVCVPVAVLAVAFATPGLKSRLQETLQGSGGSSASGPETSTAIRIELMRLSWDLSRKHAVTGAGYANYAREHEAAAIARYGSDPQRAGYLQGTWFKGDNPHNEFANQLVGGGVVGLALFLAWLAMIARAAHRMGGAHGAALAGITLAFAVGAVLNSSLMDFIEGHAFMALLALLLAEGRYGAGGERESPAA
jgi:O-antigen ligase